MTFCWIEGGAAGQVGWLKGADIAAATPDLPFQKSPNPTNPHER